MFRPSAVVPVPEGGVRLAEALSCIVQKNGGFLDTAPLIIVDDVLTTGASMEEVRGENTNVVGIVVFARGPCPQWVIPLFHMRGL